MKTHTAGRANSNVELLRALIMFMIVAYHYSIMGFYAEDIIYSANKNFVDIFGMGGNTGVNTFVMISGYYMVHSRFTLKKLLSLMGQLWFYTFGALLLLLLFKGPEALSGTLLKLSVFPLLSSHYWFVSYYVILMLLSPFLNAMLLKLDRKRHAKLALLLFVLCTVLPEFFGLNFAGGFLWLFVALYVTAAWIRLYAQPGAKTANRCLIAAAGLWLMCILKILISNHLARQSFDTTALITSTAFMGPYSPFAFAVAALLLTGFCCRLPRQSKTAHILGSVSFGVYLFHANIIVNEYLYQDIFHTAGYAEHPLLFVHAICTVILIYAAGTLIDLLRQKTVGALWIQLSDGFIACLESCISRCRKTNTY